MPRNMDRSLGDGGMPLLAELGLSFESYGQGTVEARWVPTERACNPLGGVHGGVFGVIHDAAMNFAANSALERGDRSATLELGYQIMRGASAGDELRVHADVTRLTTQIAYMICTVDDSEGQLVSRATATFLVRRKPKE